MKCPKCGQQLPDDASFCLKCGEPIPNQNPPPIQKSQMEKKKIENRTMASFILGLIPILWIIVFILIISYESLYGLLIICSLPIFFGIGIAAVITGISSLTRIKRSNGGLGGKGYGVAGLILGVLWSIPVLFYFALLLITYLLRLM